MRVLIACEMSGRVRDAFLALGHDAWSCDILPTESSIPDRHYQQDVREIFRSPVGKTFDLMIAHPPCTYLTNAGVRWLYKGGKGTEIDPDRWGKMLEAVGFFNFLCVVPVPRICIENPIMHSHASKLIHQHRGIQTIQPWMFGHAETKATQLHLKNLPNLRPTDIIKPDLAKYPPGRGNGFKPTVHYESPGADRGIRRSRTYPGIAAALAEQYGALL